MEKIVSDGTTLSVTDGEGREDSAACGILALPYHAWSDVKGAAELTGIPQRQIGDFQSSPIITVNLWLDRVVLDREFVALLNSDVHWVFNKSALVGSQSKGQYLSLVISGARDHVDLEREVLEALALEELRRFLPAARNARIVSSLVIKEKRATFSPKPGIEASRPGTETATRNCLLAGDWTDTGLPATIEGSVVSGFRAAAACRKLR